MCVEAIQRWQSVILTAALVIYCPEVVILGNIMEKKVIYLLSLFWGDLEWCWM